MKTINSIILAIASLFLMSCEDILEKNITNSIIQTTYPIATTTVQSNVVNFQWSKLDGAKKYRLQIFLMDQSVLLEKEVEETSYSYSFALPGQYQWRVRAENNAYISTYSLPVTFSTILSTDLTNQLVSLSSPQNNIFTNNPNVTLNWLPLTAAASFNVEVTNSTTGQSAFSTTGVITNSIALTATNLSQDGLYQWKVKAINATSQSAFSTNSFSLDTVIPNQPQNTLPITNSTKTISQPVVFNWTVAADSGVIQSPISYIIEFSNDMNFTSISQTSNSATTSFTQSFSTIGVYYWRVKSKDSAGNISVASTGFKFTIN